jgi:1-pyrroline-5-carboxylate dehydrogenase
MYNCAGNLPVAENEKVLSYAPGSIEKKAIKEELSDLSGQKLDIPLIINGKEERTGEFGKCIEPHDFQHCLAEYHMAGCREVQDAITAATKAKKEWAAMPWQSRAAIFKKAASLLAEKYRFTLNAATMLNQSKNVFQAEIDSACELIDFWNFNVSYMQQLYTKQPDYSPANNLNYMEYRELEGFVYAVSPFNFTSIAGNLPTAPAMLGNTVVWKPASTAVYAAHFIMKILDEAGLPPGVINMVCGNAAVISDTVFASPELAGVHFTGSTGVFQQMWKTVGERIGSYRSYPRLVGETGGKDFICAHPSADVGALATALVRGAFEFQGQKCSAASRAYIPESLWPAVKEQICDETAALTMGHVHDFSNFMNAVIDRKAFDKTVGYIDHAKEAVDANIIAGGTSDDSTGYFIRPTIIQATDPHYQSMKEEIFAPVLTVYVYKDSEFDDMLDLCDTTSPYALTGAVFARDRRIFEKALGKLRHTAGNFYINDKPTGAVVGQQPFGGGRASGTNDKAGSYLNLLRWVSPRSIKENFCPPVDYRYDFMLER